MPTNLNIDEALLEEAVKAGNHKTKRDAVNKALSDYVQRRKQLEHFRAVAGTIDYEASCDKKLGRRKR